MKKLLFLLLPLVLFFGFLTIAKISAQEASVAPTDQVLVKFKKGISEQEKERVFRLVETEKKEKPDKPQKGDRVEKLSVDVRKVRKERAREIVEFLTKNQSVEYAEIDSIAKKSQAPNDSYYSSQWGLPKINAEGGWDITQGSDIAPVAILDTGINDSNPDLSGKVIKRANFTTDLDADGDGHGTHVAGIVAAGTNNSLGVASLGYNSKLISVKVLDDNGSGYYSWIANGVIWAADNGAKVINLSLGGSADSQTLRNAIDYAWGKGVVVVAAAGNNNNTTPHYPAYYTNSIAVAATDSNDNKASFSTYGSWVDLAAPGVSILSTYENGYAYMSGTSMATPFVSALSSLVFSSNPSFSNSDVRSKIESSAEKIAKTGTYWINGRIDACAALNCSFGGIATPTPTLTPAPTSTPTSTPTVTPSPTPVPCLAPTIISYSDTNPTRGGTVSLSWNGVNGASTYRVQRQNNNGDWSTRTTTSSTSFTGGDASSDPNWRVFVYSGTCRPLPGPSTVLDP